MWSRNKIDYVSQVYITSLLWNKKAVKQIDSNSAPVESLTQLEEYISDLPGILYIMVLTYNKPVHRETGKYIVTI